MIVSDLFNVVYTHLVEYWREKIEKADPLHYVERENEVKAQLNEKLDDKTKELAELYYITVQNRLEDTYYGVCNKLFLFGLKAGMDMQKEFDKDE